MFKQLVKKIILHFFPSLRPPFFCTQQQRTEGVGIHFAIKTNKPFIALTFDDGPSEGVNLALDFNNDIYATSATRDVLTVLNEHKAKGTFFILGEHVNKAGAETLKLISDDGHELAVHGWQHNSTFDSAPLSRIVDELKRTKELIIQQTGQIPMVMRPPRGQATPVTTQLAFSHSRLRSVLWTGVSYDWTGIPPRKMP